MKNITIIGVGLMGGSIGLALHRKRWRVTGVGRRMSSLKKAKSLGAVHDFTMDLKNGVAKADAVVIATPVGDIVSLARRIRPFLQKDCLVMDVGSVKNSIVRPLEKDFSSGPFFVGCHPMAGSEKTGVENSDGNLYKKASCLITPTEKTPRAAVRRAEDFWKTVGGRVYKMAPDVHDAWAALVSHLPHILADALMITATAKAPGGQRNLLPLLAAGSFKDMTRVAGADPELWSQIFNMNRKRLNEAANGFLKTFKKLLNGKISPRDLSPAKKFHDEFIRGKGGL